MQANNLIYTGLLLCGFIRIISLVYASMSPWEMNIHFQRSQWGLNEELYIHKPWRTARALLFTLTVCTLHFRKAYWKKSKCKGWSWIVLLSNGLWKLIVSFPVRGDFSIFCCQSWLLWINILLPTSTMKCKGHYLLLTKLALLNLQCYGTELWWGS